MPGTLIKSEDIATQGDEHRDSQVEAGEMAPQKILQGVEVTPGIKWIGPGRLLHTPQRPPCPEDVVG